MSDSDSPPPHTILESTLLFDKNEQATDHVLTQILKMDNNTVEKVKLWLVYHNVHSMSSLLDLFFDDPENIKSPEYRVGSTKEYLDKWSGISLTIICKLGQHLITKNMQMLGNDDWLNLSRFDYNNF